MHFILRRTAATGAVAGLASLAALAAPVAQAHDVVIGGNPADGTVLDSFPDSVLLEFSGEPRDGFNTLAITDQETDEVLFTGEPSVVGRDVSLDLPDDLDPGPGHYRIGFQITSSDGHSTRGWTTFTVAGEGVDLSEQGESSGTEATGANYDNEIPNGIIIGVAIAGVLAVVAVAVVAIGRSKSRQDFDEDDQ